MLQFVVYPKNVYLNYLNYLNFYELLCDSEMYIVYDCLTKLSKNFNFIFDFHEEVIKLTINSQNSIALLISSDDPSISLKESMQGTTSIRRQSKMGN